MLLVSRLKVTGVVLAICFLSCSRSGQSGKHETNGEKRSGNGLSIHQPKLVVSLSQPEPYKKNVVKLIDRLNSFCDENDVEGVKLVAWCMKLNIGSSLPKSIEELVVLAKLKDGKQEAFYLTRKPLDLKSDWNIGFSLEMRPARRVFNGTPMNEDLITFVDDTSFGFKNYNIETTFVSSIASYLESRSFSDSLLIPISEEDIEDLQTAEACYMGSANVVPVPN